MPSKKRKTFFIVNPSSAGGLAMRKWPDLSDRLSAAIGKFDYDFTNASGVATMLATDAVKNGYEMIVAVGGDGTLNEVVNGIFDNGKSLNPDIILGVMPLGAGSDFARTLKLSHEPKELINILKGDTVFECDVGLIDLVGHHGKRESVCFLNMADVGIGGEVAKRANSMPKYLGGFTTFFSSTLVSLASYKPKKVSISIDGGSSMDREVTTIIIANGQYFGGGMWIAPKASLNDGLFDVYVVGKLSKMEMMKLLPKAYAGKLPTLPGVEHFKASQISIGSKEEVLINCDGEQPGYIPAEFKVLPKALKLKYR